MRNIAFWLSLAFIFTVPWEETVLIGGFGTLGRVSGVLLAAFWLFAVVVTKRIRKPHPFHAVFLLFILWQVLSVFWSIDVDKTLGRIQAYVQLIAMVYIIWDLYITPTSWKLGLQAYVLGAYVSIGSLMSNYFSGAQVYYGRYSAEGFDPNNIGIIMALGIAPAWYLATGRSQGRMSGILKMVNFLYVPIAMLAILLTGSRGALIATSVAVVYVISGFSRLRVSSRILASVFLICALFVLQIVIPPETTARLLTTGDQIESRDLNGRFDLWNLGFSAFAERPVFGVGSFAFRAATEKAKLAHNSALTILVESGLVGFGLFALLMLITVRQALQHKRPEAALWLAILTILAIGTFSLNWAHRKQFWIFPSLVIASASLAIWARNQAQAKAEQRDYAPIGEGEPTGQAPILRPGRLGRIHGLQDGG